MRRHLLHDPAFPDIVGAWAAAEAAASASEHANDNRCNDRLIDVNDPMLDLLIWLDIDATRLW